MTPFLKRISPTPIRRKIRQKIYRNKKQTFLFIAQKYNIFSPPFTWPQKGQFLLLFLKVIKIHYFCTFSTIRKDWFILIIQTGSERENFFSIKFRWRRIHNHSDWKSQKCLNFIWNNLFQKWDNFVGFLTTVILQIMVEDLQKFKFLTQLLFFAWNARHIIIHYSYPKAKRFSF